MKKLFQSRGGGKKPPPGMFFVEPPKEDKKKKKKEKNVQPARTLKEKLKKQKKERMGEKSEEGSSGESKKDLKVLTEKKIEPKQKKQKKKPKSGMFRSVNAQTHQSQWITRFNSQQPIINTPFDNFFLDGDQSEIILSDFEVDLVQEDFLNSYCGKTEGKYTCSCDIYKKLAEIPKKIDMFDINLESLSCIHIACLFGDMDKLKELKSEGRNLNIMCPKRNSALHYCILAKKKELFSYLVSLPDVVVDEPNVDGFTPFMLICKFGLKEYLPLIHFKHVNHQRKRKDGGNIVGLIDDDDFLKVFNGFQEEISSFYAAITKKDTVVMNKLVEKYDSFCFFSIDQQKFILQTLVQMKNRELLEKFLKRDLFIADEMKKKLDDNGEMFLLNAFNFRKRNKILIEILKTEKIYTDDIILLNITVNKLEESCEKKETGFVKDFEDLKSGLKYITEKNEEFCGKFMSSLETETYLKNIKLKNENFSAVQTSYGIKTLEQFLCLEKEIDFYTLYTQQQEKFEKFHLKEKWMKKKISEIEKRFPLKYRVKLVEALISQPTQRLVRYQNFFNRLIKCCPNNSELSNVVEKHLVCMKKILEKVNVRTAQMRRDNTMAEIVKFFRTKYKIEIEMLDNEKKEEQIKILNRKYIYHLGEEVIFTKSKKYIGVFVFNDCVYFGTDGKEAIFFRFADQKVLFCVQKGLTKIIVFQMNSPCIERVFAIFMEDHKAWSFFENLEKEKDRKYYLCNMINLEESSLRTLDEI